MRIVAISMLVAAGCGPVSDNPQVTDAGAADGGSDGAPDTDVPLTATTLTCKTAVQRFVQADGSGFEVRTHFAEAPGVSPTDNFLIEQCNYVVTPASPACPAGYTCTTTGDPYPAAASQCQWSRNAAMAANGKVYVNCGNGSTFFNAGGVVSSVNDYKYATVRVHR